MAWVGKGKEAREEAGDNAPHPDGAKNLDKHEQRLAWRMLFLMDGGYSTINAAALSSRLDIDHHYAVRLLQRGCPEETAVKILL